MWEKKPEEKPAEKPVEKPAFDIDTFFTKLNENLDARFAPITTAAEETRTRLQAIEDSGKKREEQKPAEMVSVIDNEDAAFAQRLGPLAVEQVKLSARMVERDILDEMKEQGWGDQIPDVREYLAKVPLVNKSSPEYEAQVRNVVDMTIGKAARSNGLKRRGNSFILEDANASQGDTNAQKSSVEDREFLNMEVVTSKGQHVSRREFLKRMDINVDDPEVLKQVKDNWAKMQVVN